MAQATTVKFGQQAILISNMAVPPVFTAPCGLTTLNRTTNVNTTTTDIPDCDDPDLANWLGIDEVSRQMVLTGSGVLSQEALPMWDSWDRSGGYRDVRWFRNLLAVNGGGYYTGSALLTRFDETGNAKARYQINISLTFDGKPTWVPLS